MRSVLDTPMFHVERKICTAKSRRLEKRRQEIDEESVCTVCGAKDAAVHDTVSASLVCTGCGTVLETAYSSTGVGEIYEADGHCYAPGHRALCKKLPKKKDAQFAYKPMNHMWLCLKQLQGKENKAIPCAVIERLHLELRVRRVDRHYAIVTPRDIRSLLQFIGKPQYYHHVNKIFYLLTGKRSPVQLSNEDETRVMKLFALVVDAFNYLRSVGTVTRKNLLSYPFMLDKMMLWLSLVGGEGIKPWMHLLIHDDKIKGQERDWHHICHHICQQIKEDAH